MGLGYVCDGVSGAVPFVIGSRQFMNLLSSDITTQRCVLLNVIRRALYLNVPPECSLDLGLDAKTVSGVHCFLARNISDPYYTFADGVGVLEVATEALIDEIVRTFDPAGVPYCVPLAPGAKPAKLPFWLSAQNFTPAFSVAVFVRDSSEPNPVRNDIRVERVGVAEAGTFARINAEAFGLNPSSVWYATMIGQPNFHAYIAFDGDVPVGTGLLAVAGQMGWLAGGATLPEARGRGVQAALIARRVRDATTFGCDWMTVETREPPDPSYRNVERAGFQLAYALPYFVRIPEPLET
jgi:GNAT superfamily N-acetyltransferase